jgi:hypothetical protein
VFIGGSEGFFVFGVKLKKILANTQSRIFGFINKEIKKMH